MSSFATPRAAPSLPVNEPAQLSPKHSPRDPAKTFSRIMSNLHFTHESSNLKPEMPKCSTVRPVSGQSSDVQMVFADTSHLKTSRASVKEVPKKDSTNVSHCTLPPSQRTSSKPTPKDSYTDPTPTTSKPLPKPQFSDQTPYQTPEYTTNPSAQTRYVDMLLGLDAIPRSHNLFASFSTWILLAGFVVVPGTFVSVENSKMLQEGAKSNAVDDALLRTVKHASLIWIAGSCCLVGGAGMVWLWWRWRSNYVWLINKIFLVGLLNSVAGLISTLINVYSQHGGSFSITAKITVGATASCTVITAILYFLYNFWILQGVRKKHQRELELESGK